MIGPACVGQVMGERRWRRPLLAGRHERLTSAGIIYRRIIYPLSVLATSAHAPGLVVRAFCQAAGESNTDQSALTNQRFNVELYGRLSAAAAVQQLFSGGRRSRSVPPRGARGTWRPAAGAVSLGASLVRSSGCLCVGVRSTAGVPR